VNFLNLNFYHLKCASAYPVDVVGGTAVLTVGSAVLCSAYVPVCGCAKGTSLTLLIMNVANANVPAVDLYAAALQQFSALRNGSRSIMRKNSPKTNRTSHDLLLTILSSSLLYNHSTS
jgi:hypothetical protein